MGYFDAISRPYLPLVSSGGTTQMGFFLFVEYRQGSQSLISYVLVGKLLRKHPISVKPK